MILQGKTPRTLTFIGLLGVAALGLLMLPLVFSGTQEAQVGAQVPATRDDPARAAQLDRARAEIEQMQREVEKLRLEMQKQQDILRERAAHLEAAMRRLREVEVAGTGSSSANGTTGAGVPGGRGPGVHADNNIDQRLKRLESKVDTILDELRKMKHGPAIPSPRPGGRPEPTPNSPDPAPRRENPAANPFGGPAPGGRETKNDPTLPLDTPVRK